MPNLPYKTLPEYNYIGKPGLRPKQGYKKVIGEALFSRDYTAPGMLYAKCLSNTPYAHARIKNMDTGKAAALPGVVDIIRFDDPNDKMAEEGATGVMVMGGDRGYRFIEDTLYYSDQPFGAIVCAESEEICDEALRLIEIEWEELPFSVIPAESLEENSPLIYPELNANNNSAGVEEYTLGDIEKGFTEADHIIEFTSEHAQQTVAGVEGNSAMVKCEDDDIHIWSQQQFPNQCEM
ncbi:MAG: molybdopterin-dependent oxidoreductase, partial [Candidatus Cloacimonetes bacterium]|nr:molybdopterin-dependent oxidoreductase [Candidatus Cloacimonadota bacterium]